MVGDEETVHKPEDKAEEARVTLEQVRAKLAALSQRGKTEEVRALVKKYGSSRLTEVSEEKYCQLLRDAEGISG